MMTKRLLPLLACTLALTGLTPMSADAAAPALDFEMTLLDGKPVDLEKAYGGKVVLVVNVASKCGFTPQYAGLQALYEKYEDKGLVVLGVPCNQFGGQEPGGPQEIATFCEKNYGVTFPILSKVDVNGPEAAPLYEHLKSNAEQSGDVRWNFEKFLISREGKVVGRYSSGTTPSDAALLEAIQTELAK